MDSSSQTPQPEQKQSIWSKLFGGKKSEQTTPITPPAPTDTSPSTPLVNEPVAPTTFPNTPVADVTPPSFDATAPADLADKEESLPPINNEVATPPALSDTPEPITDIPTRDQVPQEDFNKVDEALNALPPLPVTPDVPPSVVDDNLPQPPIDPMVSPIEPVQEQAPPSPTNPL